MAKVDRVAADALLGAAMSESAVVEATIENLERARVRRAEAWMVANEAGVHASEIADRCRMSVGLVKLEIGKAKKARAEKEAS